MQKWQDKKSQQGETPPTPEPTCFKHFSFSFSIVVSSVTSSNHSVPSMVQMCIFNTLPAKIFSSWTNMTAALRVEYQSNDVWKQQLLCASRQASVLTTTVFLEIRRQSGHNDRRLAENHFWFCQPVFGSVTRGYLRDNRAVCCSRRTQTAKQQKPYFYCNVWTLNLKGVRTGASWET